jgi:urease accessory protein
VNLALEQTSAQGVSGWAASLDLRFARRRGRTAIVERHHVGPLAVQRPFYPETNGTCHTYLLHPPAGIVGGDQLAISLTLEQDASALVTTPGANRWYYTDARPATITQHVRLGDGASLEWLPQETLVFDGADARLTSTIELSANAHYFGWETVCLGRPACGESFTQGRLDFRLELWREKQLLLRERVRGDGLPPGLGGYAAFTTLIASGANTATRSLAREVCASLEQTLCGVSLIGDLLICRGLAHDCAPLTQLGRTLWAELRPELLGHPASPPRIWRT